MAFRMFLRLRIEPAVPRRLFSRGSTMPIQPLVPFQGVQGSQSLLMPHESW